MVSLKKVGCICFLSISLFSCVEEVVKPYESLLAGTNNNGKSWKLTEFSGKYRDQSQTQQFWISCTKDNILTFYNKDQAYVLKEYGVRCTSYLNEGDMVESGTWTLSGTKTLNIACSHFTENNGLFSVYGYPFPAKIIKLTQTQMVLELNVVFPGTDILIYMTFTAEK